MFCSFFILLLILVTHFDGNDGRLVTRQNRIRPNLDRQQASFQDFQLGGVIESLGVQAKLGVIGDMWLGGITGLLGVYPPTEGMEKSLIVRTETSIAGPSKLGP
jgi:hypothetical protein